MSPSERNRHRQHKPAWLKRRLSAGSDYEKVRTLLRQCRLHTVCQEALCPNLWECFARQTATFLIMGPRCTRNCRFCAVEHGPCLPPDPGEARRVAEAVRQLNLRYVVITSVTRDDLPDGGADCFARTIRAVRRRVPDARVEVLVPDFGGDPAALRTVVAARPDVLNHNLETVPRLYAQARPGADYRRSLELLRQAAAADPHLATKSGLMLGLGETDAEIHLTLRDLIASGCRLLTLGQYLQPSRAHLPVARFVTPEAFADWRRKALELGFSEAACGPLVRSSYRADALYQAQRPSSPHPGSAG